MTGSASRDTGRRETAGPSSVITSTRNGRIIELARLHRRRDREAAGRYLVEGPRAVAEVLAAGLVETVLAVPEHADEYAGRGVEVVAVAPHVLAKLADSRTPQGVVAVARREVAPLASIVGRGILVVLAAPSDPGNLGTVIRTADAAGAAGVVVAGAGVDPWNPKVVRSTTGSLVHLPIALVDDLAEVVAACRAANQQVVALDMHGDREVFDLERDTGPVAIVVGSEAHGLPPETRDLVDAVLAVPTYGRAESLNLAAATAVALYAAARGRRSPD